MQKKVILVIVIVFLLAVGIYFGVSKKEVPAFSLAQVTRGNVSQEVSETGQVKKGEEINIGSKTAARIEKIYVKVGEEVKIGDILAKLDTAQLQIQLRESSAALDLAKAKLNKLLAGASKEEIQVAQTAVDNAKTSLESARQNLKDINASAEDNLNAAYEDALNVLDDAYLKADNAFKAADVVQRAYFNMNDQEGIRVRDNEAKIEEALLKIKSYLDAAKSDSSQKNIDLGLSETKNSLDEILDSLRFIREICENQTYRSIVSSTDKTSLDNQKSYISTALTSVTNSQQTISLTKLTNEYDINTAKSEVSKAEGVLKTAQDELSQITAPPRKEDVDLYQAQVKQAEAQVQLLEKQIEEATLRSPVLGQITQIKKRVGEMTMPSLQDVLITLLPLAPFEIEVNIYEEDVVKMAIGNPVDISLVAFPEQILKGRVVEISPAENLIEGVVYYKVTIDFEEVPEGIKPGMTADLVIKTASKENVLTVPQDAIQNKEGKTIVEVLKGEKFEEREIEIGLKGSNDIVEVISGLEEGEKVTIR